MEWPTQTFFPDEGSIEPATFSKLLQNLELDDFKLPEG